jgi:glycosyltransferase involved in cell wall biosynthesis
MNYKKMLYMCEYPPGTDAGGPIIAKKLFEKYDMSSLHIMCCKKQYEGMSEMAKATRLKCKHYAISGYYQFAELRPKRIFAPLCETLNCLRVFKIIKVARSIIAKNKIEAIFVIPWKCEFALSAYFLSLSTGLPLYVFEMDDWELANPCLLQGYLTKKHHKKLLKQAEKLWLLSPTMVKSYRDRFHVNGEFILNFCSTSEIKKHIAQSDKKEVRMVYTGSFEYEYFYDTIKRACDIINAGIEVCGKRVRLSIYSKNMPNTLIGQHVDYSGFVNNEKILHVLCGADILLLCVSFSQKKKIKSFVKTALYAKIVDYLASGRPILVIAPLYSEAANYLSNVAEIVPIVDKDAIVSAMKKVLQDTNYRIKLYNEGQRLVASKHSKHSLQELFLKYFLLNQNQ